MKEQAVFKRYETKYMLTPKQKREVLKAMLPYMKMDDFGHSTIRNIYFDTEYYRLIRRSIEKPSYKEKLRIRSYSQVGETDKVFVELKKKYDSVVYKRREAIKKYEMEEWLCTSSNFPKRTQIGREIDYFFYYYETLEPKVFLSYEREAFYEVDGGDFRVTFDENVLAREEDLDLGSKVWGTSLLEPGMTLMELKCSGGYPIWMEQVLTREKIYPTSFSKYGTAYKKMIMNQETKEGLRKHA